MSHVIRDFTKILLFIRGDKQIRKGEKTNRDPVLPADIRVGCPSFNKKKLLNHPYFSMERKNILLFSFCSNKVPINSIQLYLTVDYFIVFLFFIHYFTYITEIILAFTYEGESLHLPKVTRNEMGMYLCIASNGVPPAVSQRVQLTVNCKYTSLNC